MSRLFLPTTFPCGCVAEQKIGYIQFSVCRPHLRLHKDGIEIDEENDAVLGCDCPMCEFGRYARRRYDDGRFVERSARPDNWEFFARLLARRTRART